MATISVIDTYKTAYPVDISVETAPVKTPVLKTIHMTTLVPKPKNTGSSGFSLQEPIPSR